MIVSNRKFLPAIILLFAIKTTTTAWSSKGKLVVKKLEKLNVDPKSVTVTGFSSGGAQAMHFHLSHSSKVSGAGIFSGGPNWLYIFWKLQVVYLYGYYRQREDFFVNDIERFNVTQAIQITETFSIVGSIDPVENLKNSKVYIYHGRKDTTVESGSGRAIESIYKHFDANLYCNIEQLEGEHGMGFMYIPSGCFNKTCKLSIVFHGCLQNRQIFGDKFPRTTGYVEVAELNDIIQIYPNTRKTYTYPRNPSGCWDWMGFTGKECPTRYGLQTQAVYKMLERALYGK